MTRLTTLDLSPLTRASIGFDRLFEQMDRQFTNAANTGYPPYNIIQLNDDEYMITMAVAGFDLSDLQITKDANNLTIEGTSPRRDDENINYIHRGIASRSFKKQFTVAEYVEVESASLELGMLNVHLKRIVPEEKQPKKIAIKFNG